MADQNESNNRRGMNTLADDIDRSPVLSELERIGARASRKGIQRTELEDRIKGEGKLLNSLLDQGRQTPEFRNSPFYQEQTGALRESIRGIRSKMNSLDTTARTRAESEASTYIARQFAPTSINGQASTMQREAAIQNRAFSMSGQSYDELESRREEVLANIRVRERQAQNEVKGMFTGRGQVDPEKSAAVGVMMSSTQEQFRQLATINAAQAYQRAAGIDPNSKMRNLGDMGQAANSILSAESIAKEIQSGGVSISQGGKMGTVANEDVSREIVNQARLLSQALKELADGAGKTDDELAKLRASADESAENMKKLQDAQKSGAGQGGWNAANVSMGLAGGFNAAGMAAQQILVNQRMQQVSNIAGFAGLANQQYDMYGKARSGDIASQLALGQFGDADQFGMEMKRGTNVAQTAFLAAGAAQTVAGGVQVAEGLGQKVNPLAYASGASTNNTQAVITGGQNVVQGLATTAVTATDMAKGTSAEAARLAGDNANMQARQAVNAIGAKQMQGLRDMYTGLDVVGQSMGSRASSFIQEATGEANLQRMVNSRMSPEQFTQMAQLGSESMGSTFDSNQIFASRNLEARGFGSMQTNMQRMATLAGAGANNPKEGMESVLSAAVSKGLDSSKSITMMVENTAAIVSTSAGAAVGIDTTSAASSLLASSVNTTMANKEMAIQQAANAADITRSATTNREVSFTGMANTAGLQSNLSRAGIDIGGSGALTAQGVDMATLKTLQGDPKKTAEFFRNKGVNITEANAEKFLSVTMTEKERQIMRGPNGGGLATGFDLESLREKATSKEGIKPNSKEFLQLGEIAERQGRAGGAEELIRELKGVKAPNVASTTGKDLTEGQGPDDLKKQMDALRTSGFKQLSEAAKTASENLGKFGGALKVFTELQNKFEQGGMGNEKEFTGAAAKFAESFTTSTSMFKDSVGEFDRTIKDLANKVGLRSNGIPAVSNQLSDAMDKSRGASSRGKGGG